MLRRLVGHRLPFRVAAAGIRPHPLNGPTTADGCGGALSVSVMYISSTDGAAAAAAVATAPAKPKPRAKSAAAAAAGRRTRPAAKRSVSKAKAAAAPTADESVEHISCVLHPSKPPLPSPPPRAESAPGQTSTTETAEAATTDATTTITANSATTTATVEDDGSILLDDDLEDFMALLHTEKNAAAAAGRFGAGAPTAGADATTTHLKPPFTSSTVTPAGNYQQQQQYIKPAFTTTAAAAPTGSSSAAAPTVDDASEAPVALSSDQAEALERAVKGENLFITGGAGTGKSLLIRTIVHALRERSGSAAYGRQDRRGSSSPSSSSPSDPLVGRFPADGRYFNTYVTATTGVAALNVGGQTINAFSGINFNNPRETPDDMYKKMGLRARKAMGRWGFARTVIIDEVSMMDPDLFNKLNYLAKRAKRRPEDPFGGIQIILCGDFLQLPPVSASRNNNSFQGGGGRGPFAEFEEDFGDDDFSGFRHNSNNGAAGTPPPSVLSVIPPIHLAQYCFQTVAWRELNLKTVLLSTMHRHGRDDLFQRVLSDVRQGVLTPFAQRALEARRVVERGGMGMRTGASSPLQQQPAAVVEEDDDDALQHYVRLCGTNREVDARNAKFFADLAPQTLPNNFLICAPPSPVSSLSSNTNDKRDNGDGRLPYHAYFAYDIQHTVETSKAARTAAANRAGYSTQLLPSHVITRAVLSPAVPPPQTLQLGRVRMAAPTPENNSSGRALADRRLVYSQWERLYAASANRYGETNLQAQLPLKLGARVMLLTNISTKLKLVNGSVGDVTGFLHPLELVELMLLAPLERKKDIERAKIDAERNDKNSTEKNDRDGDERLDALSQRARQLLAMGGFQSYREVFRCVDTSHADALFTFLRSNGFFSVRHLQETFGGSGSGGDTTTVTMKNRMQFISYGSVFGTEHLEAVMRVVGLRAITPNSNNNASATVHGSGNGNRDATAAPGDPIPPVFMAPQVPGGPERALVHPPAAELFLHSFAPADLAAMRLPIVRFSVEGFATENLNDGSKNDSNDNDSAPTSDGENGRKRGGDCASNQPVYAFVSPSTYATVAGLMDRPPSNSGDGASPATTTTPTPTRYVAALIPGKHHSRSQLPLRHAWAVTVHKAQGLTIRQLEVDAGCFFSPGQAYVALSRARDLASVRLINFDPSAVRACEVAKAFYAETEREAAAAARR